MTQSDSKEQMDKADKGATKRSGETHSGSPNPADPSRTRSSEHKSDYGGDGGEPRTSPDTEQGED
jgi:hypothetical protein